MTIEIGQCFVSLCRNHGDGAILSLFQSELALQTPEAKVTQVYRDRYSEELCFVDERGQNQQRYWRVTLGKKHYLLPCPVSRSRFDVLDGFERIFANSRIDPSPEMIRQLIPALLTRIEDRWVIDGKSGVLHFGPLQEEKVGEDKKQHSPDGFPL